jgi:16S rRNA (uracil1498-N3)-methyltransferase
MERFYLFEKFIIGSTLLLDGNEHHHLTRVVRARENDEIELVNGFGGLATAKIEKIDKERTSLRILHVKHTDLQNTQIAMGIPLMRPSKLEWVIEKGTELGVDAFYLYLADHSTQDSLSAHQIERLRAITISALKQSKRLYLPHLEILPSLSSLLTQEKEIYFGDVHISAPLLELDFLKNILFITGPESGFSKKESDLLEQKGRGVRLGPHVLRAETAPIAAASILSFKRNSSM